MNLMIKLKCNNLKVFVLMVLELMINLLNYLRKEVYN